MKYPNSRVNVVVEKGKLYVLVDELWDNTYIDEFDPKTNMWVKESNFESNVGAGGFEVVDGRIYMIESREPNYGVTMYDIAEDKWKIANSGIPTPREGIASAALNGKIYVFGGYNYIDNKPDITKMSDEEIAQYFKSLEKGPFIKVLFNVDEYTPIQ